MQLESVKYSLQAYNNLSKLLHAYRIHRDGEMNYGSEVIDPQPKR